MNYFNKENIKNLFQLKQIFRRLSKQYHPDNQETGDAEKFVELKNEYEIIKATLEEKDGEKIIHITTTQAYKGCQILYKTYKIDIHPKYNGKGEHKIILMDKNRKKEKVIVKIVPEKDEILEYIDNEILITKKIDINIIDAIIGCTKNISFLGKQYDVVVKPYEILKHNIKRIANKGYPSFSKKDKCNPLILKFNITYPSFTNKDIKKLKEIGRNYE